MAELLRYVTLDVGGQDRKSTRLNSSHGYISYAVLCLKKKNTRRARRLPNHLRATHTPTHSIVALVRTGVAVPPARLYDVGTGVVVEQQGHFEAARRSG